MTSSPAHGGTMGQKRGEIWTTETRLQPMHRDTGGGQWLLGGLSAALQPALCRSAGPGRRPASAAASEWGPGLGSCASRPSGAAEPRASMARATAAGTKTTGGGGPHLKPDSAILGRRGHF